MIEELSAFRREIDALDDELIALLKRRIGVVKQVGALKERHNGPPCPIRPGREALMTRRIAEAFAGSDFPPAAAVALWRQIIGASTAAEAPLILSVYAPQDAPDLFWLAREYFGPTAIISRQPHAKRVVGDVLDKSACVGIIPTFAPDDAASWSALLSTAEHAPRVFAMLPVAQGAKKIPQALAIASIAPEDSGDDRSIYVLAASHDTSQHRLQTALGAANLQAEWIATHSHTADERHHLIELKGFVSPGDAALSACVAGLNGAVRQCYYLGAYATPIPLAEATSA